MLADAVVLELTHRFQARTLALATAIGQVLQSTWLDLAGHDEGDIAAFEARTAPTVRAAKSTSVSLATGYYSAIAQLRPPSLRPDLIVTELDTRQPFISHWRALKMGRPWEEAVGAGADGADAAAANFVASTARRTGDAVYDATGTRIVGWRRIPEAGACDWCLLVSTQRYRTAESADFGHRNCHCSVIPIFGESDPGRVINHGLLEQIKSGGTPEQPALPGFEAPKLGPHPDSVPAGDIVTYAGKKSKENFSPTIDRLSKIHGAPKDTLAPTQVVAGGKATAKGGHFTPGARPPKPKRTRGKPVQQFLDEVQAWRSAPLKPEIRVNDRGDGTGLLSFLHEYGHRIDYVPGPATREAFGNFVSRGAASSPAMTAFQQAARTTPTIQDALTHFRDFGYVQYFRDPAEVWARAYSQWAAQQLEGPELAALRAQQSLRPGYQWSDEEFAALTPLVESVLRERNLMV